MSIDAVNGASKNNNLVLAGAVSGSIAGGATSYFTWGKPMTVKKFIALNDDKFEKNINKITDDKKPIVDLIKKFRHDDKNIEANVNNILKDVLVGSDYIDISDLNYKTPEQIDNEVKNLKSEIIDLQKSFDNAKNISEKADALKSLIDNKIQIAVADDFKDLIKASKNNKVPIKDAKNCMRKAFQKQYSLEMAEALKALGKDIPKTKSWKHTGIGALIGAVIFGIIGHFINSRPTTVNIENLPKKA